MTTAAPAPPGQLDVQVRQYQQASEQVHAQVLAMVAAAWIGLRTYHDQDEGRFLSAVLPIIDGGQRVLVSATSAYLARLIASLTGSVVDLAGLDLTDLPGATLRNGTPPETVYARPFITVWTALSEGKSLEQAVRQGSARLANLVATDLQLARTHAARAVMQANPHVVGYRRVPNGNACALCLLASTQRYRKSDLMPIHPNCQCGVAPIVGTKDPGRVIDKDLLKQLHQTIAEKFGAASFAGTGNDQVPHYRNIIVTHHHGEIGPVLGVRGQKFSGPDSVPA